MLSKLSISKLSILKDIHNITGFEWLYLPSINTQVVSTSAAPCEHLYLKQFLFTHSSVSPSQRHHKLCFLKCLCVFKTIMKTPCLLTLKHMHIKIISLKCINKWFGQLIKACYKFVTLRCEMILFINFEKSICQFHLLPII